MKLDCLPFSFPPIVGFDIETCWAVDGEPDPYRDEILTVQIDVPGDNTYILTKDFVKVIPLLVDPSITKLAHNMSFDSKFLLHHLKAKVINVFDTMLTERILTAGKQISSSLESVASRRLGIHLKKEVRKKFNKRQLTDEMLNYAAQDATVLYPIYKQQIRELQEEELVEVAELENQLAPVVGRMELNGIDFDQSQWERILIDEQGQRDKCYKKVVSQLDVSYQADLFGDFTSDINLNSRNQILGLLEKQKIHLPNYQMATLQLHLRKHPEHTILRDILDYKEHEKRLSWDYPKHINPKTGRIHPNIHQLGSRTGRFAFTNPNLQQVPKLDSFRKMFVAREGYQLITADYSQIELRVLAEVADDKTMIGAFKEGEDFHQATAELIARNLETEPDRALGKNCNFAAVYGSSAEGLSTSTGIPVQKWKEILKTYFNTYSALEPWYKKSYNGLVKNGYTTTLSGRKRWFPELTPETAHKYQRVARNTPIQGGAQDIIKLALIYVDRAIESYDARLVHTIHDEIIVETIKSQVKEVVKVVEEEMIQAGAYFLKEVPVKVNLTVGPYWSK